jgi:hypothetical protein
MAYGMSLEEFGGVADGIARRDGGAMYCNVPKRDYSLVPIPPA